MKEDKGKCVKGYIYNTEKQDAQGSKKYICYFTRKQSKNQTYLLITEKSQNSKVILNQYDTNFNKNYNLN